MQNLNIIGRNGISVNKTVSLNLENIIKYQDNGSGKCEIRYDGGAGPNDRPIDYTLSISKAALDLLILQDDSISLVKANIYNLGTGILTPTSFNNSYITSLVDGQQRIDGILDSTVVEIGYNDGSFTNKRLYANGTIATLVYARSSMSGKKIYSVLLTQTGTAAPTAVVLEDAISGIVWARTAVGTYTATKVGAFVGKFMPNKVVSFNDDAGNLFRITPTSANVMTLTTYAAIADTVLADAVLLNQYIHFELYA